MILVYWGPKFSPEFEWEHPNRGVKCKGDRKKIPIYLPTEIDGYMLRCVWPALNSLSIHVGLTFTAIVPEAYTREAKCAKNVLKWRTFELTGWITGKRLKIYGYMLRCIWQALNPLSIHVTFTAIVPWAYPGEAKMCLRLSWRSQMPAPPAKRLKATTYRRDSWGSQIIDYALGWLQKLTHVPLATAILLVLWYGGGQALSVKSCLLSSLTGLYVPLQSVWL